MTLRANVFPEVPAPKKMVRLMSQKLCFRGPLEREDDKWGETMLQCE